MDIAIIGANGSIGRQIAIRIIMERLLGPTDRLQLVGRRDGRSGAALYGFRQDLKDAFSENCPLLDVALEPEDVVADIVIMAAGATIRSDQDMKAAMPSRDDLAIVNRALAIRYADALCRYGHGHEIVVVVTNPVEFLVDIFSARYDRKRVIGIGAYQDSLRFRREVARSINVSRQAVRAMAIGEHGDGLVPLWSSVIVQGFSDSETRRAIHAVRGGRVSTDYPGSVGAARAQVIQIVREGRIREAFALFDTLAPDVRVVIGPFLTLFSGAKTDVATANATVDLVCTIVCGRDSVVAAQVQLRGEFEGVHTSIGVPIIVNTKGWESAYPLAMTDGERQLFLAAAVRVQEKIQTWTRMSTTQLRPNSSNSQGGVIGPGTLGDGARMRVSGRAYAGRGAPTSTRKATGCSWLLPH